MERNWRNQRGRETSERSPWQSHSRTRSCNNSYANSSSSQARFGNRNAPPGQNWECSSCRFSNFSSRTACFKCRTPKGESSSFAGEVLNSWKNPGDDSSEEELIDWDSFRMDSKKYEATRLANLPPLMKNVYFEDPDVQALSCDEVERFRYVEL
ncbi:hypothetical protein E2C01_058392 [Portunus trituberculatus]|uniref:RanBP2-type domain-containing protein n=1 Tax=Portunus trituberculatus TaxID=210409 RepID=A0A5B7GWB3_PORTR|nr:hypothetical protein [Portunus trituberculatus]